MPKGSKIEEVYDALRREGMSKERAAKIAQAQTGLALATDKPPKGTENMTDRKELDSLAKKVGASLVLDKDGYVESVKWNGREWSPLSFAEKARTMNTSYSNGRQRALNAIDEKMKDVGVENSSKEEKAKEIKTLIQKRDKRIDDLRRQGKDFIKDNETLLIQRKIDQSVAELESL